MTQAEWEYSDVIPEIHTLAEKMTENSQIDIGLYSKYDVKRGLRDIDGKGVLTGLTDISTIKQNELVNGKLVPCDGVLSYRGFNVNDIVNGIMKDNRFGFEEVVYLLLFGEMPTLEELKAFKELLVRYRTLPQNFVRDVILKAPSHDMMNTIARSVLTLFCYDKNANDTSIDNVLRQCIQQKPCALVQFALGEHPCIRLKGQAVSMVGEHTGNLSGCALRFPLIVHIAQTGSSIPTCRYRLCISSRFSSRHVPRGRSSGSFSGPKERRSSNSTCFPTASNILLT